MPRLRAVCESLPRTRHPPRPSVGDQAMTVQTITRDTGLDDPKIAATLKALHRRARSDVWRFLRALPAIAATPFTGKRVFDAIEPYLKDAYIPVDPDQGKLLYV